MKDKKKNWVTERVALGSSGHTEIASVLQCQRVPGKQYELVCVLIGIRAEHTASLSWTHTESWHYAVGCKLAISLKTHKEYISFWSSSTVPNHNENPRKMIWAMQGAQACLVHHSKCLGTLGDCLNTQWCNWTLKATKLLKGPGRVWWPDKDYSVEFTASFKRKTMDMGQIESSE